HAAAGGVGSLLCQWSKHLGAQVIGTVGGAGKVDVAKGYGCDHVIDYSSETFADRVLDLTGGTGVQVIYDSVGKETYEGNIAALAPIGYFVNYGHASGLLPPIDAMELNKKSIFFGKTSLKDYTADKDKAAAMAREVFGHIKNGVLRVDISREYSFEEIGQAHRDLAGRKTTGSIILVP
ncbi:MAG: zinc-binding dehydrogenase, partial [Alphaproteobacteria bacterium]|nr:zinc-binding dehydrogenase [Alphaproteobacteria bacterium]